MIKFAAAAMAAAAIALPASTAFAQSAHAAVVPITQYQTTYNVNQGDHSGDWTICGHVSEAPYTQPASCTESVSVSTGVSGNIGYSIPEISASAGFNVSVSVSVGQSFNTGVMVKPGGSGNYDAGIWYDQHEIGLSHRTCNPNTGTCGPWSPVDNIIVQDYIAPTGLYFGTGAS